MAQAKSDNDGNNMPDSECAEERHLCPEPNKPTTSPALSRFELSDKGKPLCYEAAIRVMLNLPTERIIDDLGIPEEDIELIRLIYTAETSPEPPLPTTVSKENLITLRKSYLMARGEALWTAHFGSLSKQETEYLQRAVNLAVDDGEAPRLFSLISSVVDEQFEQFELLLSRLILIGQHQIMSQLKTEAQPALLELIAQHEAILAQQLVMLDSLSSTNEPALNQIERDEATTLFDQLRDRLDSQRN